MQLLLMSLGWGVSGVAVALMGVGSWEVWAVGVCRCIVAICDCSGGCGVLLCAAGGRWHLGLPGCRRLSVHGGVLWLSGLLRGVAIVLMGVGSLDFLAVGVCRCMVTAWPADRYDRVDFKRNSTENLFLKKSLRS